MMKALVLAPLLLAFAATTPRVEAHQVPTPSAAIDTATSDFEVNGLHVILRRNTSTDVVAANLYLLGGTRQLTPANQGIEALLFAAAERGSRKYPGLRLRQEIARVGSQISVSLDEDWTAYGLKAIRSTFDTSWVMFTDRLLGPTGNPARSPATC